MKVSIFSGASRIQLRDGTELKESNPRILKTIIHEQLHTHLNRFKLKPKRKSRGKAKRPKNLPALPALPAPNFADTMAQQGVIKYH